MEDKLMDARIKALLMAARTMAFVICTITIAMIAGLFVSNEIIDNKDVFGLLSYVMTSVVGAVAGSYATLMGMKGELVPPAPEDRNDPEPEEPAPAPLPPLDLTPEMAPKTYDDPQATVFIDTPDDDDDDDDMEPWEKYRGDLRYDANGDGVVDENDFPDWRSAGQ
ncbi:hypothetical protein UFOVP714_50 [uncultured Caudovirales phage]|uniref:EF-hand domain-containing protein n=1 Tax=uncultured Caudovirales phage TaxID=2100421 RepID=A0A6J5NMR5_9CAUD|nr:hypothetical protein UFOVP714_50 [uncultured Caudovirales phage]CAB4167273.1 hypothetical protein UFOVP864_10 [uncultured Caudovirales phage]